jgi:hypothetical protein
MADPLPEGIVWDYIFFWRANLRATGGRTGKAKGFQVAIVRENFIPEETIDEVIESMESIAGMRLAGNEFPFDYIRNPKSGAVSEILLLNFVRPGKV